jgi:hypothetical protein
MISARALSRATLSRQMLLARANLTVREAIEQSVVLNAQQTNDPYLWLWTRLADFRSDYLTAAIADRTVVRSTLLRGTQHLVSASDYGWLRAILQPLLNRLQRNVFGRRIGDLDADQLIVATREILGGRNLTRPELGRLLEQRWPGRDRTALAWSAQYLEPVLHPMLNSNGRNTPFVLASDWLGPADSKPDPSRLIIRYLSAYGPATVGDIRAWSGVAGLREVVERLRPELVVFRDESGRELFDLPDAPRPDPDTEAPVRFLPEFDNLLLAYTDRNRIMTDEVRAQVCVGDAVAATILVDGAVRATWTLEKISGQLRIHMFGRLSRIQRSAVEEEAEALQPFCAQKLRPRTI